MTEGPWYGREGEVYGLDPQRYNVNTPGALLGYGNREVIFSTQQEWLAYQNQQEANRQAAVVVKQSANAALRAKLGELSPRAAEHPHALEFLVILEDGGQGFFGNRNLAQEWGRAQAKAYALCEIRSVHVVDLSEEDIAARVAAL